MPHVFVSYVREDQAIIDRLRTDLERLGVGVWLDRTRLKPGQRWRSAIRKAIQSGACFVACFSAAYAERDRTYMNEEITEAISELRLRPTDRSWFIPVLLSPTKVPDRDIGAGETLRDLQFVDLTIDWAQGVANIAATIRTSGSPIDNQPAGARATHGSVLRWDSLAADSDHSPYETFAQDLSKPWWPEEDGGAVVYQSGKLLEMYGKLFDSHEDAERYGQWLRATHNHRSFSPEAGHTLYFERTQVKALANVPILYAAISNVSQSQVVITTLQAHVLGVAPLKAIGQTAALDPAVTYELTIPPRPGVYSRPLIPALKIGADDAIAFRLVLRPSSKVGGYAWLMQLRLITSTGTSCDSPCFQLTM